MKLEIINQYELKADAIIYNHCTSKHFFILFFKVPYLMCLLLKAKLKEMPNFIEYSWFNITKTHWF